MSESAHKITPKFWLAEAVIVILAVVALYQPDFKGSVLELR